MSDWRAAASTLPAAVVLALLAAAVGSGHGGDTPPARSLVDHHVHVLSPALVRDWKSLGVPFSRPDAVYTSASPLFEGAAGTGIDAAILVPMAHLYGNEDFRSALRLSPEEEHARVRAENDHVAREAARLATRAVAFCSVGALRPYAWDEIRRCRKELGSPGLKLHLASAGADLKDEKQLEQLAGMAAWAEAEGVALLLHFDPQRRGLEASDVERFIARVLAPHPRLELVLAHLGGSGGYGPWTRAVFRVFREWRERAEAAGGPAPRLYFDVSAVVLEKQSEGVPATTDEEVAALAPDLRRAGLERVLFGSDHPVFDPRTYARVLAGTGLTPEELAQVLGNRAPLLQRSAAPAR